LESLSRASYAELPQTLQRTVGLGNVWLVPKYSKGLTSGSQKSEVRSRRSVTAFGSLTSDLRPQTPRRSRPQARATPSFHELLNTSDSTRRNPCPVGRSPSESPGVSSGRNCKSPGMGCLGIRMPAHYPPPAGRGLFLTFFCGTNCGERCSTLWNCHILTFRERGFVLGMFEFGKRCSKMARTASNRMRPVIARIHCSSNSQPSTETTLQPPYFYSV
jgi:hypothetical protein